MALSQEKTPLMDAIQAYLEQEPCRLHMPGHKGQGEMPYPADLTEIPGLDDLHQPAGVIKEAQQLAAEAFGARETFFLVNGATAGILAAFLALVQPGDKVILPRHAHKSVFNALVLSGALPLWVPPVYHPVLKIPLGVSRKQWEQAWEKHPGSKLLFLVHPTYEGITSIDEELIRQAKARGFKIIVDEAHGSHFPFHPGLPPPALSLGADVVIHGSHKTVGSLTQSGMLHLGPSLEPGMFQGALSLVQSTSPSYLLMASLDEARRDMVLEGRAKLDRVLGATARLRDEIKGVKGICFWHEELYTYNEVKGLDPTKIIIDGRQLGLTGYELAECLRESYGIQVEMAAGTHLLALFSFEDSWVQGKRLLDALKEISRSGGTGKPLPETFGSNCLPAPQVVVSPRDSWFAPKRQLPLEEAAGAVAGQLLVPYPPGIPLLCPGELITHQLVDLLVHLRSLDLHWQGLIEPELKTIQVLA